MRADSAVEPTKSENITVTWRRSARSSGEALGVLDEVAASAEGACALASLRRAAIASRSFTAMPECRDAKLLQVFRRQVRQDRLVNLVLAERSLILSEAKAPQPDHDVHDGARASPWSISSLEGPGEVLGGVGVRRVREGSQRLLQVAQGRCGGLGVLRVYTDLRVSRASQRPLRS